MASIENKDRRVIVYPNYIDSTKTVAEGRMISKSSACPTPNVFEMMEACEALKLPAQIEDKHYSRAWWIRARLRVQIKNADGTYVDPEITSKQKLLVRLAQHVPKTPMRQKKGPMPMNILAMPTNLPGQKHGGGDADGAGGSKGASSSAPGSGSSGSNKKKKGRK